MEPTLTHSQMAEYKGDKVEIRGEVFDTPIKKSQSAKCYTRITFFIDKAEVVEATRYFEQEMGEERLKMVMNKVAENLPEFL